MDMNKYTVPLSNTATTLDIIDTIGRSEMSEIEAYIGYTDEDIVGIEADFENNTFTRLAGAVGKTGGADFSSIAPWSGMRRCVLADNGTVNAYYGEQGYVEDGTAGQVMVEIPKFYYRVVPLKLEKQTPESVTDTNRLGYHLLKANYYISATPKDGFKIHPLFVRPDGTQRDKAYISAYEGNLYDVSANAYLLNDEQVADVAAGTGDKLSSIGGTFERSYTYYDQTTQQDVTITINAGAKPCSGEIPSNNLTRHNCTVLAQNRGTGWQQQTIQIVSAIQLLFAVEYASFNWQAVLDGGVSSITDDGKKNCASFVGSTASLGNSSGAATSTIDRTGTAQTANGKVSVSYRGIENFFGNIYKWTEGVNLYGAYNNGGGQPYICTDGMYTENIHTNNYEGVGFTVANVGGYIRYFGYGSDKYDWLFLTSLTGHGANTALPVGDYTYITSNLNSHRGTTLGGSWYVTAYAGGCCWSLSNSSDSRARTYGARLAYLPSA